MIIHLILILHALFKFFQRGELSIEDLRNDLENQLDLLQEPQHISEEDRVRTEDTNNISALYVFSLIS